MLPPLLVMALIHAAGEAAVLGGDARGQNLRLFNGVLDEQILRLREQVVVDVDAVDHEHVVEREAAVDRDLTCVWRVFGEARGESGDSLKRSRNSEEIDLILLVIGANGRS